MFFSGSPHLEIFSLVSPPPGGARREYFFEISDLAKSIVKYKFKPPLKKERLCFRKPRELRGLRFCRYCTSTMQIHNHRIHRRKRMFPYKTQSKPSCARKILLILRLFFGFPILRILCMLCFPQSTPLYLTNFNHSITLNKITVKFTVRNREL